jgi:formate dehydrogenase major subunit/formate dehydrogenase alpha subunit
MFGAGAMTNSISEIRGTDLMFVIGSNTTEAHPIIAMEMKRAVRRGARLIVADPRAIWLTQIADKHLQLKPGTDVALLNALAHVIIAENLIDHRFVEDQTEGYESVVEAVGECTPEWAEEITGVPAEEIRTAARWYATTPKAGIYYTLGVTEHTHGTDNVYGLANLVSMTGHLGKRHAGLNPLRGQNNVQGANDAGATPIFLPGYQRVTNPEVRGRFEEAWGVSLPHHEGMNLNVMMKAMTRGRIKGLYVIGEDLVVSEPNANSIEDGLNRCEFIAVQDILPNEMLRFADVVLPAACFAEKDGVVTNSDRRVQRVRKAVEPPGEARPDWRILCDVAREAGYPMPRYQQPSEIYAEMASLAPKFAGISHQRIDEGGGLQWPCPAPDHPGTPTLHAGGPMRGKVAFQAIAYRPSEELPDEEYPLVLSTGRTLYHYNAGTMTRRSAGATLRQPVNFIEMHRRDANRRGVKDGQPVRVTSRRGSIVVTANVSAQVRRGCVWMPLHFAESSANRLTNDAGDTVTGTAEYKVCAVQVEPVPACSGGAPSI